MFTTHGGSSAARQQPKNQRTTKSNLQCHFQRSGLVAWVFLVGWFFPISVALLQYGWAGVGTVGKYLWSKPDEILMKQWAEVAASVRPLCILMYSGSAFAGNEPQTLVTFA